MEKQVDKNHYEFSAYVDIARWSSYWHQIDEVLKTQADSLLIVGTGDRIVKNVISKYITNIADIDIDPELTPTYVGSITELDVICSEKFDTVLCCQVLEHLPFSLFETSIAQLANVCTTYCVLSLPQKYLRYRFALYLRNRGRDYQFVYQRKNRSHFFNGEHYWEIGTKGCSIKEVEDVISKYFTIERSYSVKENPYHYFFILKKIEEIDVE